jgi:hypothetical protein
MEEGKQLRVISPAKPTHSVNAVCCGDLWRTQQNGAQIAKGNDRSGDIIEDYGFWCVLNGEMQFFTV